MTDDLIDEVVATGAAATDDVDWRRLSGSDALNATSSTARAVFACPPGVKPGGFVGEGLFV